MGRFRLRDDDYDDDENDFSGRDWEFVADQGMEGSMIRYNSSQQPQETQQHTQQQTLPQQPATIYYIVQNGPTPHEPHQEDSEQNVPPQRRRRFGWCSSIGVALLAMLVYYGHTHGPPAPPPNHSHDQDDAPIITWRDYTRTHNAALYSSLRAYLLDTTWHYVSWTVPQLWMDVTQGYQSTVGQVLSSSRHCQWTSSSSLVAPSRLSATTTQPQVVRALQQILEQPQSHMSSSTTTTTTTTMEPVVVWASQMTPGLGLRDVCREWVQARLPHCRSSSQLLPLVSLQMERHAAPRHTLATDWFHRIRERVQSWNGSGGIVLLEHVEELPPQVLQELLDLLVSLPVPWMNQVVLILALDTWGVPVLGRHWRRAQGRTSEISKASLDLDLRHELSSHVSFSVAATRWHVLPLWCLTKADLEHALRVKMEQLAVSLGFTNPDQWRISERVRDELLSTKRIEWVQWNTGGDGSKSDSDASKTTTTATSASVLISTQGQASLQKDLEVLERQLQRLCRDQLHISPNKAYRLEYDLEQMVVVHDACPSTAVPSCHQICSFDFT